MMESYREVDQTLEEPALRLMGIGPEFFENFVAVIELAPIEQLDAPVEQRFENSAAFVWP